MWRQDRESAAQCNLRRTGVVYLTPEVPGFTDRWGQYTCTDIDGKLRALPLYGYMGGGRDSRSTSTCQVAT